LTDELEGPVTERRRRFEWMAIGTAVAMAYACGIWGLSLYYEQTLPPDQLPSVIDLTYYATRLFIFEWDVPEGVRISVPLQLARWLAPASLALATVKLIAAAFRDEAQVLLCSVRGNHAVVCGLGRKGLSLVKDLKAQGIQVVAIEKDGENPNIEAVRSQSIPVLKGNAADRGFLAWAGVAGAPYLFAVTGDDEVNLQIAARASELRRGRFPRRATDLRCAIHVEDPHTADLFADAPLVSAEGHDFGAHLFSIYRFGARVLLEEHPPDLRELHEKDAPPVCITIFGEGQLAHELVLQLARIGHYGSRARPIVRVICTEGSDSLASLEARRTVLEELIDLRIDTADMEEVLSGDDVLEDLFDQNQAGQVYICLPNLAQALRLGAALNRVGEERVLVCTSSKSTLAGLVSSLTGAKGNGLETFDVTANTCTFDNIMRNGLDAQARKIHELYCASQEELGETSATNSTLVDWHLLPETFKESNRSQADHLSVKLRAVGRDHDASRQLDDLELSDDEVTLLAELEHRRWYAEKRLAGWRHAPGPKDPKRRLSPSIVVGWTELSEAEKDKDRDAARNLSKVLKAALGQGPNGPTSEG